MTRIRKYCLATLALLVIGMTAQLAAEQRRHTVQAGQNLFRISQAYGVTVQAILDANPGITENHVPAGMTLVIPEATREIIVDALTYPPIGQETATSHEKPVAEPHSTATTQAGTSWCVSGEGHWTDGTLNITVALPFNLNAASVDENKVQMRNVEFYEGVLMAVDEMQESGRRVKVQAFDLTTQSLYNMLYSPEMQQTDVVIAAGKTDELRQLAEWSDMCGTPVVSPFDYNASMQGMYQNLFQVNTPKSMLYPQLTSDLLERFADYTFIFVTDSINKSKIDPYPAELKRALTRNHIAYRELSYQSPERLMACDSILGLKDENILFVPVTPQPEAMRRMFSGLQHVKILRDSRYELAVAEGKAPAGGQPQIAMLGYPEWVLNTSDFINYYYDLNVYMFTKFYANPFDNDLKDFYRKFKQWYGKEPMSLAPKYALLGYDTAKTFLQSLSRNGQHLEERITGEEHDGLQTMFCFADIDGRGFYNRGFYLVHFTPQSTIEKIAVR